MKDKAEVLIGDLGSMNLADIKRGLSDLAPPYPDRLLSALKEDKRTGAQRLLESLHARQRAEEHAKQRIEKMLRHERKAHADGFKVIAGVDEVGRGPLAGPVVASAVILPAGFASAEINDSKLLSDARRRKLLPFIIAAADVGIGVVSVEQIDRINILRANELAIKFAIEDLDGVPDVVLIDGKPARGLNVRQRAIVKGDRLSLSIAAASIVAKVTRDQMMLEFDRKYPHYEFAKNKGYGTLEHMASIKEFGVSPIHRRSFAPVAERLEEDCV